MSWLEIISLTVTLAAIFVGLAAAAILVGQRPAFWGGLVIYMLQQAWPYIVKVALKVAEFVTRRNTPEIEVKMQECIRRGGEWDNFNKRCREKK